MKKYLLSMVGVMALGTSFASVMCSSNDYVTLVLDPGIAGTSYTYNAAQMSWTTTFPYGNISGVAACNDNAGTFGVASNQEQANTGGVKCWCKMTHPAVSRWVFRYSYSSASGCAGHCADDCGALVRGDSGFRVGVFGSIGN